MGLFFREGGVAGGPAVVFLHGAAVSGWMWADVLGAFPGMRTFAPDLPGLGGSGAQGPFRVAGAADAVAAFIRAQVPEGAAHVVGHSLGGAVAARLLAAHPEVVRSAVLIGVTARPVPFERAFVGASLQVGGWVRRRRVLAVQARLLGVPEAFREVFVREQLGLTAEALRAVLEEGVAFRVPGGPGPGVPTLVLVGAREGALNVRSAQDLVAWVPGARGAVVPGGDHAWLGRRPDLLVGALRAWWGGAALPGDLRPLPAGAR
ncbi:alpha/beta fold hydrolase [Deinococcus maricopensis]|uniref:Alpha/beta hydrolase fold protein n=1 Tax=Deinococcus maricopensis (strain DSM 21211 / LMG 22137 / NRRL B-23946 / LB-34) TaxID=709986 RepID=E8U5K6_DEIML|nr:alpha/beta fold hydrolase [Deinococcus maricopensis]ADV66345.1 alpha/beta hydrolase fold protein [Deinococcus maricopensis DSM 21211]